ncbi:MAG TPA: hypothetical protein VEH54_02005 [Steroidobacteraceae bacterium]|nr:hypothetical protein [Steroidobacteraceae bacterium]
MTAAGDDRKVKALAELARSIEPPSDLWPAIEARLDPRTRQGAPGGGAPLVRRIAPPRWLAAAAMVAAVAVGVWIGRSLLPGALPPSAAPTAAAPTRVNPAIGAPTALDTAYVSDPRYERDRAALMKSLAVRLEALPPPARAKVVASLQAITKAKEDLEAALGKDPGNALLEELLVNTYQDEMRVLTDLHEASDAGKGI